MMKLSHQRYHGPRRLASVALAGWLVAFLLVSVPSLARGASNAAADSGTASGSTIALAKWQQHGDRLVVLIPLADALTAKQKDMISGGFTTVSLLNLRLLPDNTAPRDEEDLPIFYTVRCSVKFDAWEETYDVARLDDHPRTALLKKFSDYGEMCLKAELDKPDYTARLAAKGGTLLASLVVKQTSTEEADHIKDWLIQQQSGVMQSLFSHMLGELSLNQTIDVKVSVPPKPDTIEKVPARKQGTKSDRKGAQIDGQRKG